MLISWYSTRSLGTKRADRLAAGALPDLLTVEEAAVLLRVGRNQAYQLTRQWRATRGERGLPVIEIGPHCFRVPLHGLEEFAGTKFTAFPAPPPLAAVPGLSDADSTTSAQAEVGRAPEDRDAGTAVLVPGKVTPLRRCRPANGQGQLSLFDPSDLP